MLSDEQARGIALFFLFSLMDEKTALAAAHKAVASAKAAAPKASQTPSETAIVTVLRKTFETHRKLLPRNRPTEAPLSWKLPPGIDAQAWAKFHQDSSDGEIVAIVLAKVLGFSEEAIAEGLNVSLGTLKYRIGKGMRQLGAALGRSHTARA
ncbi:MAG: hypothetical protein AAB250_19940 [Bdellovibrionota bacterium]